MVHEYDQHQTTYKQSKFARGNHNNHRLVTYCYQLEGSFAREQLLAFHIETTIHTIPYREGLHLYSRKMYISKENIDNDLVFQMRIMFTKYTDTFRNR